VRISPLVVATALVAVSVPRPGSAQEAAPAKSVRNVSGGPLRAEQACFDVRHYRLAIAVDPAAKTIAGTLTMRATWLAAQPELQLDLAAELSVRALRLGGEPVPFEHRDGVLHIRPAVPLGIGKEFQLAVDYGGTPHEAKRPPWDGGFTWAKTKDGAPWIATTCQGEGADLWWPCKDHPSDKPDGFDLLVTVPKGLVVAGNGTRQGEPQVDGELATFHWQVRSPISNYNIALAIAPYVELTDTFECIDGTVMPIQCFVLPSSAAAAKKVLPRFLDHVKAFEELLGPYPFRHEKYGFVETPHLGMEHQTMIAYGNGFADEPYDWLHNHELAHEWWGNLVTCRDWKDMWLHEGFGTYLQPLYLERRFGRARYDEAIRGYQLMNRQPIAPREVKNSHEIYFSSSGNDIYYKGSAVLHTLRWLLGDERLFAALRRFCYPTEAAAKATDGSQVRFVDTDDFVRLCSEIAGADVGWFFEVYVRQAALPRLQTEVKDGVLLLRWTTPRDLPFPMPVPVLVDGVEHRVPIVDGIGRLQVGTRTWQLDPERRLLMGKAKGGD
jgi:aminopeptidase N